MKMEFIMRLGFSSASRLLFLVALSLAALTSVPSFASFCASGQQPVPPAVAARLALPACGFAATDSWGQNGCQLCDSRNIYPNPFGNSSPRLYRK